MLNNFNPLLSLMEFFDDIISGSSAHYHCQWRGPVVPAQRLARSIHVSEALLVSHAAVKEGQFDSKIPEPYTLEMEDGTLVTFLLVKGTRCNVLETDVWSISTKISAKLAAYMNSGTGDMHSFGMYFLSDPHSANQVFMQKVAPMIATAKRLGGNIDRFVDDMKSAMVSRAAEEMTLLTVRTHVKAMRPEELKAATKNYADLIKTIQQAGKEIPEFPTAIATPFGQALITKRPSILQRHEGLVTTLLVDFNQATVGISVMLLSLAEAAERVRRFGDREIPFMPTWKPALVGQRGAALSATVNHGAPSPVALGMQLMTRKVIGSIGTHELSQVGNTFYGTAVMERGPISPRDNPSQTIFSALMQKVRAANIPVSISFEILPKGLNYRRINQFLKAFLGSISTHNRQIRAVYSEMEDYQERNGVTDPMIGWRVSFSTWGKTKEIAEKSLQDLTFAIQGWGSIAPIAELGCPDIARLKAIPEYSASGLSEPVPIPLADAVFMSPMMRPASQWEFGQLLYKTNDGVIYPVMIGSGKQRSSAMGICAPSGSGKSFALNRILTCMALAPGLKSLPYSSTIDVAPSSEGSMRLLRSILPKELHSQILYYKVVNSGENCVNPHDLQLGCTALTERQKDNLIAVYEVIFDGIDDKIRDGFITLVIVEAYRYFAPDSPNARRWEHANDERVNRALEKMGFEVKEYTSAFQVTDALFRAGYIEEAVIAQRFAVPRLNDLSNIIFSARVKADYEHALSNGEPLLTVAARLLSDAVREYHVLSGVTMIDIDSARIKTIDLNGVLGGTSARGKKFAGLMYLYARHLSSQLFFLHVEDIERVCRPEYLAYQTERIREIQQTPKLLNYDEWHNVREVKGLVGLNIKEIRETRKYRVFPCYVTQYIPDFPEEMLGGLQTIFVVGRASHAHNLKTKAALGLSNTDFELLEEGLNQTGRFWAWFNLTDGPVTAILNNDVGGFEHWCYTTDDTDAPLRAQLESLIGETPAIDILAKEYPSGSAKAYIEARARDVQAESSEKKNETVIAAVARELATKYFARLKAGEMAA